MSSPAAKSSRYSSGRSLATTTYSGCLQQPDNHLVECRFLDILFGGEFRKFGSGFHGRRVVFEHPLQLLDQVSADDVTILATRIVRVIRDFSGQKSDFVHRRFSFLEAWVAGQRDPNSRIPPTNQSRFPRRRPAQRDSAHAASQPLWSWPS